MEQYQKLAETILRELCIIPAPSHYEDRRAAYCLAKLKEFGFDTAYIDEAKNVVCEITAENSDSTIILAAHTDVVFPDMEMLPFWEDDKNIYCPGCGDDTVCMAQLMSVMKKIRDEEKNQHAMWYLC